MFRTAFARRAAPAARRLYSTPVGASGETAFVRERRAVKEHAGASAELWRKISIYGTIPCLIGAGINAYFLWNEHWNHWNHMPPLEERTEYSYQNIRTRNFPWGDGDKTIFWNPQVNYHNKDKLA
uniref:Cytochrome c oxidase subunit 13, mitochondrial n=2 Tax=Ophiostomataceae TaxID=5152 RepID=M4PM61_9PEZI|nr:cytochrome c oxidase subunit [Grosmannia aurea]AGH03235.1 cytochrome c oxidase subunit [Grosmannia aurea]AGH03241.1 cytochrome c oxidase subunit [Grosmannia aurea]AGH03244.1 cytochrome c oxidase subunit [Leptographium terebrantis]